MTDKPVILAVQDTTRVNYNGRRNMEGNVIFHNPVFATYRLRPRPEKPPPPAYLHGRDAARDTIVATPTMTHNVVIFLTESPVP
ncbi:MAG: hypothetical protein LBC27_06790 [Spirochaetaceae bacterium]|nr:hypothetical protein [Spirochaetaceae bacterium]